MWVLGDIGSDTSKAVLDRLHVLQIKSRETPKQGITVVESKRTLKYIWLTIIILNL